MTTCNIWHSNQDSDAVKRIRAEILDMCRIQCSLSSENAETHNPSVAILAYSANLEADKALSERLKNLHLTGLSIVLSIDGTIPPEDLLDGKLLFTWTDAEKSALMAVIGMVIKQEQLTGKTIHIGSTKVMEYVPSAEDLLNQSNIDRLTRFSQMVKTGMLSQEEYDVLKESVLAPCRKYIESIKIKEAILAQPAPTVPSQNGPTLGDLLTDTELHEKILSICSTLGQAEAYKYLYNNYPIKLAQAYIRKMHL